MPRHRTAYMTHPDASDYSSRASISSNSDPGRDMSDCSTPLIGEEIYDPQFGPISGLGDSHGPVSSETQPPYLHASSEDDDEDDDEAEDEEDEENEDASAQQVPPEPTPMQKPSTLPRSRQDIQSSTSEKARRFRQTIDLQTSSTSHSSNASQSPTDKEIAFSRARGSQASPQARAGALEETHFSPEHKTSATNAANPHLVHRGPTSEPVSRAGRRRGSLGGIGEKIPTISVRIPTDLQESDKHNSPTHQASRRSSGSQRKRKQQEPHDDTDTNPSEEAQSEAGPSARRLSGWKRPKSPATGLTKSRAAVKSSPTSASRPSRSRTRAVGSNVIRRARSKSEGGSLAIPGDLYAGYPTSEDDSDDDNLSSASDDPAFQSLGAPALPSYEAFKTHALKANPQAEPLLLERFVYEQLRRFQRLAELRIEHHVASVEHGQCASGERCARIGQGPRYLVPRRTSRSQDSPAVVFYVVSHELKEDVTNIPVHVSPQAASFPDGVALPPVRRFPVEFECPFCFEVKEYWKPSDWTKHVHEDLHPFTCTWPNCNGQTKSFKRKADWLRHENERHRHLEKWSCSIEDCDHVCFRKDNFVQHLVREHKLPEPSPRRPRSQAVTIDVRPEELLIPSLVRSCHFPTGKLAENEPCRFCGLVSQSWKNATTHLAKHMEQLSLPICQMLESLDPSDPKSIMELVTTGLSLAQQGISSIMTTIGEELQHIESSSDAFFPSGSQSPTDLSLQARARIDSSTNSIFSDYTVSTPLNEAHVLSRSAWLQGHAPVDSASTIAYRTRTHRPSTPTLPSNAEQFQQSYYGQDLEHDRFANVAQTIATQSAPGMGMHTYPLPGSFMPSHDAAEHANYSAPHLLPSHYASVSSAITQSPTFTETPIFSNAPFETGTYAHTYPPLFMTARGSPGPSPYQQLHHQHHYPLHGHMDLGDTSALQDGREYSVQTGYYPADGSGRGDGAINHQGASHLGGESRNIVDDDDGGRLRARDNYQHRHQTPAQQQLAQALEDEDEDEDRNDEFNMMTDYWRGQGSGGQGQQHHRDYQ